MLPLILFSLCVGVLAGESPVKVTTSRGCLTGFRLRQGHCTKKFLYGSGDVFLGIPYATAGRFQKPKSVTNFGAITANKFGPACPQAKNITMSEDCLTLNVFTPKAKKCKKYPVMVLIHGGTFQQGSAQDFDPKAIIRNYVSRGVVVVTIQYRLGLLGFFTTHSKEFPANLGMLDQVEALRWVRDQIHYFGGNHHKVTLLGFSAGAGAVSAHTYSPLSRKLFHRAIQHSGAVHSNFQGARIITGNSQELAKTLCGFTIAKWQAGNKFGQLLTCLKDKDFKLWLDFELSNIAGWQIVQDTKHGFMPNVPRKLAEDRKDDLPLIVGSMKDEFATFLFMMIEAGQVEKEEIDQEFGRGQLKMLMGHLPPAKSQKLNEIIDAHYIPKGTKPDDWRAWMKVIGDAVTGAEFTSPIQEDIRDHLRNGNKNIYVYEMTRQSPLWPTPVLGGKWKPVGHGSDLPYLQPDIAAWLAYLKSGKDDDRDLEILDWMAENWTYFAKHGKPADHHWHKACSSKGRIPYLEIGEKFAMRKSYRHMDEHVWTELMPRHVAVLPQKRPDFNNGSVYDEWYMREFV